MITLVALPRLRDILGFGAAVGCQRFSDVRFFLKFAFAVTAHEALSPAWGSINSRFEVMETLLLCFRCVVHSPWSFASRSSFAVGEPGSVTWPSSRVALAHNKSRTSWGFPTTTEQFRAAHEQNCRGEVISLWLAILSSTTRPERGARHRRVSRI